MLEYDSFHEPFTFGYILCQVRPLKTMNFILEEFIRMKKALSLFLSVLLIGLTGCGYGAISSSKAENSSSTGSSSASALTGAESELESGAPWDMTEPFIGRKALDSETEQFILGTWKVEKLLGFGDSYNDASEYPNGQKIIGDEITIQKDFFSSKGLKNYEPYQFELKNPSYQIEEIHYNKDSFYRVDKIDMPSMNDNDHVVNVSVSASPDELGIPMLFLVINNKRLILQLEATVFELKRV